MKTLTLALLLLSTAAFSQRYGGYDHFFKSHKIESTPEDQFLYWINSKRKIRLSHQVKYKPENQKKLNEVAVRLENHYCHCNGTNYTAEVINKSLSLEDAFYSFMISDGHRKAMMLRRAKKATVGINYKDDWYYVVVRLY